MLALLLFAAMSNRHPPLAERQPHTAEVRMKITKEIEARIKRWSASHTLRVGSGGG